MSLTLVHDAHYVEELLVKQINDEHQHAQTSLGQGAAHAARCGELLSEAKLAVEHGEWTNWLRHNFAGSERTARRYLQLADLKRNDPDVFNHVSDESIAAVLNAIAEPAAAAAVGRSRSPIERPQQFKLTIDQLEQLIRSFGVDAGAEQILRWIERQTEPQMILCPDCTQPVMRAIVKGELILAERDAWLEHMICPHCIHTRNAHPGVHVNCAACNDTGTIGSHKRPAGRVLAIDVAWADETTTRSRLIGPTTDRRRGEALHPLHACQAEQAA